MEALIFDTTFLIDFQRERSAASEGPAHGFLRENAEADHPLTLSHDPERNLPHLPREPA